MNKLTCFLLASCLLLSACSSAPSSDTFSPAPVASGHASIYIYRPGDMENALYAPELHIDDAFRLKISNGRKVHFSLPAKTTRFALISDYSTLGDSRLELELEPGQTRFLRIDTTLELDSRPGFHPYRRGFSLLEVPAARAVEEIARCCNDSGKSTTAEPAAPAVDEKPDGGGFSTDKTNNPFSH